MKFDIIFDNKVKCDDAEGVFKCYENVCKLQQLKKDMRSHISDGETSHVFFKVILQQRQRVETNGQISTFGRKSTITFVDLAPW